MKRGLYKRKKELIMISNEGSYFKREERKNHMRSIRDGEKRRERR